MIHALPGMGGDRRMFPPPWDQLPAFKAHDWPRHMGENSLAEMAARLCDEFAIRDGDTVIGASLGGMIGCEIAKQRKLATLYLVGSAVHRNEVNRLLSMMRPLISLTPVEWLQFSANRIPHDLAQMFATVDPAFVRAMCRAIFDWEGLNEASVRLVRLHGGMDFVIPPPPLTDLQIDKAGHLLSMTHPRECVEYIISQDHAA